VNRSVRTLQWAFFTVGVTGLVATFAAIAEFSVEWVVVTVFLVYLFTIELGAPWYDRPWWRTRYGLLASVGFVLYVAVLLYSFA